MERSTEYITDCPEYNAAGLDLIQAELTIVALVRELERVKEMYELACTAAMAQWERAEKLQKQIAQLENR